MKRWISFDFEEAKTVKSESNGSLDEERLRSLQSRKHKQKPLSNFNFQKKIAPKTVDDLAVHKKKVEQLKQWLLAYVIRSTRNTWPLLTLVGPTGCGKTSALNVLCAELNVDVVEWINPLDRDYENQKGPGQSVKFVEFVNESKYPSLITGNDKKLILIEDFPNTFLRDNKEFHNILEQLANNTRIPIVFICTETNNIKTDLYQNLFPEEIRIKYNVSTISFNAASATLLKAALKRVQKIIEGNTSFVVPSSNILDAIANSSMGDIRCATNNYHIAALHGGSAVEITEQKSKKRKRSSNNLTTNMVLRDHNLGIFHLLGRILNPKRKEHNGSWRIDCNVNEVVDEFCTFPNMGFRFLQHNYLKYYSDFAEACISADILSQTEIFLRKIIDSPELHNLGLWYCTLGFMITNEHKASKWNQINAPKMASKLKSKETEDICIMDGFYYDIINNTNKFCKFL